jgi:L-threonylcarbamoyladenylate synthase
VPEPEQLIQAVAVLRGGGVVAFPTDTLYGLAADPRSREALDRLFTIKERDRRSPVPLIAADAAQAAAVAVFDPVALFLAKTFWPGPLSLVLDARPRVISDAQAADGSVAIRVPASTVARDLAGAFGFAITATSANLAGHPPTSSPDVVRASLAGRIDFLLDGGESPGGRPSTIVDPRGPTLRLVRAGALPWERVLESLE